MKAEYIIDSPKNKRLVVFFTGWSTGLSIASLFRLPEGYDFIICWDYRNINWKKPEKNYVEVLVFAWSFGVAIVEELFHELAQELNITGLYAINGSRFPVNDELGIPEFIFKETLENLNEKNLHKFKIRIAGGLRNLKNIESFLLTDLSISELKNELELLGKLREQKINKAIWDCVFISTDDKIFPALNLEKSWNDTPIIWLKDDHHLPDFASIISRTVKDKEVIKKNFKRSITSYNDTATVQKSLSHKLIDVLKNLNSEYASILELGSGSGYLSQLLIKTFLPKNILLMDLSPECPVEEAKYISGDIETLIPVIPVDSFDLVVSGSTMQWFHSPSRILSKIFSILKNDGIAGITTFLPETYHELQEITGNGLLYYSESDWTLMARRNGFEVLESSVENYEMNFNSVNEILKHLRATGVNSLGAPLKTIGEMRSLISSYPNENSVFNLTYQALTLILKKTDLPINLRY